MEASQQAGDVDAGPSGSPGSPLQIVAIEGGILRDEDEFLHAGTGQSGGFGDQFIRFNRYRGPPDERDGTERTGIAAPLGDLQVGEVAGRGEDTGDIEEVVAPFRSLRLVNVDAPAEL